MEAVLRAVLRLMTAVDRFEVYLEDFPDDPKEDASLVQGLFDAYGEAMYVLEHLDGEQRQLLNRVVAALHSEEQETQARPEILGFYRRILEDLGMPAIPGTEDGDSLEDEDAAPGAAADRPRE